MMAELPNMHGWTHRPKELGGTDPIEIAAGSLPPSAHATTGGLHTLTLTGTDVLENNELWVTPGGPFSAEGGNPAAFDNIMIEDDGFYRAVFMILWSTDFGASTFPFIEPGCVIDGTQDSLVNAESLPFLGPMWDNTQSWIGGEQFTAAEQDHHSLVAEVLFNLSFSVAGISTFGVSNVLRCSFAGSKSVGGKLAVTRLGDYMEQVT